MVLKYRVLLTYLSPLEFVGICILKKVVTLVVLGSCEQHWCRDQEHLGDLTPSPTPHPE